MEKNIFEGAKFGDKFVTKNNHVAVLLGIYDDYVCVCTDDGTIEKDINLDGTLKYEPLEGYDYNIVSKYQEPFDEDKLDELAKEYNFHNTKLTLVDGYGSELEEYGSSINAFKAGYRKAKEE